MTDFRYQLAEIKRRLRPFYTEHELEQWLESPHPQLEGDTAMSRLSAGRANDVLAIIDRLESGAYL